MPPELALGRCITELRLKGHSFDALALALAECAVDALVAAGFREANLDRGIEQVVEAMCARAAGLRCPRTPARAILTLLDGTKP